MCPEYNKLTPQSLTKFTCPRHSRFTIVTPHIFISPPALLAPVSKSILHKHSNIFITLASRETSNSELLLLLSLSLRVACPKEMKLSWRKLTSSHKGDWVNGRCCLICHFRFGVTSPWLCFCKVSFSLLSLNSLWQLFLRLWTFDDEWPFVLLYGLFLSASFAHVFIALSHF